MESTWENRDLPVLDAVVQYAENTGGDLPQVHELAPLVGLDEEEVGRALLALDGNYLDTSATFDGPTSVVVDRIYPAARRAVGQWPTPEGLAERILAGMQAAAAAEPDEEKRTKLRQTAGFLGSAGKDLFINLLASVIARGSGI